LPRRRRRPNRRRRYGLVDIARNVIGCHLIEATRVQSALDDEASNTDIARHVIGCHSIDATRVQTALDDKASNIHQALAAVAEPATAAAAAAGGRGTLVHFLAQRMRFLSDRGRIYGVFMRLFRVFSLCKTA